MNESVLIEHNTGWNAPVALRESRFDRRLGAWVPTGRTSNPSPVERGYVARNPRRVSA